MRYGGNRKRKKDSDPSESIRSLERGLSIIRAFRPGTSLRGNSEIAELTGLPRATVSRLTQTLVACRFLERDRIANAYRLSPIVLGLAESWLASSELLPIATPLMNETSEVLGVNVSLAVPDRYEVLYLYSARRPGLGPPRRVTTGHCIPIETTSLGHAYLATLEKVEREELLSFFEQKSPERDWVSVRSLISQSLFQLKRHGYCRVDWLPGIAVFATAVEMHGSPPYLLSVGTSVDSCTEIRIKNELAPALLRLRTDIISATADISRQMKNKKLRRIRATAIGNRTVNVNLTP